MGLNIIKFRCRKVLYKYHSFNWDFVDGFGLRYGKRKSDIYPEIVENKSPDLHKNFMWEVGNQKIRKSPVLCPTHEKLLSNRFSCMLEKCRRHIVWNVYAVYRLNKNRFRFVYQIGFFPYSRLRSDVTFV